MAEPCYEDYVEDEMPIPVEDDENQPRVIAVEVTSVAAGLDEDQSDVS